MSTSNAGEGKKINADVVIAGGGGAGLSAAGAFSGKSVGKNALPLAFFCQKPYLLWVNKKGRRYIDESVILNENMEVLNNKDDPIPGLYAAGVDTGGWVSDTYSSILPGTAFGFALNSGRIAGENVVKYVS